MDEPFIENLEDNTSGDAGDQGSASANSNFDQNNGDAGDQGTSAPQFDPQQWSLNFRGQNVLPKDRDHLVNLAQKGWSYEQSMEQLNQERAKITGQQQEFARYAELDKAIKGDPQFALKLSNFISEHYNNAQNAQQGNNNEGEYTQEYIQLKTELDSLRSWKDEQMVERAQKQIDSDLAALASKYSNFDWQTDSGEGTLAYRILKHAHDHGMTDVNAAFRDLMFDNVAEQTKFQTLKQQKEQQQRQHRQGVVQTGAPSSSGTQKPVAYNSNDSYNDLVAKALKQIGG